MDDERFKELICMAMEYQTDYQEHLQEVLEQILQYLFPKEKETPD